MKSTWMRLDLSLYCVPAFLSLCLEERSSVPSLLLPQSDGACQGWSSSVRVVKPVDKSEEEAGQAHVQVGEEQQQPQADLYQRHGP